MLENMVIYPYMIVILAAFSGLRAPEHEVIMVNHIQQPALSVPEDDRLERIHMTDLQGRALTMADFAGKAVFLNFWATWCKPCVQEMNYIQRLHARYGEDIVFLAASRDDLLTIQNFQQQHGLTFQFVRLDIEYIDAFVISLPTTLLINREGEIIHEEEGVRVWDSENYENRVRSLLD